MMKGLRNLICEEKLRELGLFSLDKEGLVEMLSPCSSISRVEDRDSFFTSSDKEEARDNGNKSLVGRSGLDRRGNFFML